MNEEEVKGKSNKDYAREVMDGMLTVTQAMARMDQNKDYREATTRVQAKFEELPNDMDDELFHDFVHELATDFQLHLARMCTLFHVESTLDELERMFPND